MADTPSERRAAGFVRANTVLESHALSSVQTDRTLANDEEEQRLLRAPSMKPHVQKMVGLIHNPVSLRSRTRDASAEAGDAS